MGSASVDRSFVERCSYACECGVIFSASRWRWIDGPADQLRVQRVHRVGPVEGRCPDCGREASSDAPWVEIDGQGGARLHVGGGRRAELVELLRDHLDAVARAQRGGARASLPEALLTPALAFGAEASDGRAVVEGGPVRTSGSADGAGAGPGSVRAPTDDAETPAEGARLAAAPAAVASTPRGSAPPAEAAGVPKAVGSGALPLPRDAAANEAGAAAGGQGEARLGTLLLADGVVTLHADVDGASRRMWGTAALRARPIHVRGLGYPLVGVRVVATYLGQVSVIDGLVDVASEEANAILHALARNFRLELVLHTPDSSTLPREVVAPGLERNATLCMESARAALAAGTAEAGGYGAARDRLAAQEVARRLRGAPTTLGPGDYRYLVSPRETWQALTHLDEASAPDNLAVLLELDGLAIPEFEELRRRVLASAIEHGLCAPRRFWRRVVDSGLAEDPRDYVKKLVTARLALQRAAGGEDALEDLDAAQRSEAWQRILDYCKARKISPPRPVLAALGLRVADQAGAGGGGNPSRMASGVIGGGGGSGADGRSAVTHALVERLKDPRRRLSVALELLDAPTEGESLAELFGRLDGFDADELIALLPSLVETPGEVDGGLVSKLMSPSRELRQVAAFALASRGAAVALVPLCELLLRERTAAWHDVARAIGVFGGAALGALRGALEDLSDRDAARIDRVARALAEVAVRDGEPAVAELREEGGRMALAVERALAMLPVVERDGERIRGEGGLEGGNPALDFSHRMHEALGAEEFEDAEVEMVEETQVIRIEDLEMM